MATRLKNLKEAVSSIENFDTAAGAIKDIASAADGLSTSATTTARFTKAISALSEAAQNISKVSESFGQLSAVFSGIATASEAIDTSAIERVVESSKGMRSVGNNFDSFAKNISSFSTENLEKLSSLFQGLWDASNFIDPSALSELTTAASLLKSAGQGIGSFVRNISSVGESMEEASVKAGRLEMFIYGINDATKAIDLQSLAPLAEFSKSVGQAGGQLKKFADALEKLSKFAQSSDQVQQTLQLIDAVIEKLVSRSPEILSLSLALTDVVNSLKAINRAGDVGAQIEKVRSSMSGAGKAAAEFVRKLMMAPWNALKNKISGLVKPLAELWKSFKRIAMYRALRSAIREITQGFAEGVKHLYAWASLVGNDFKGTMDSLATSAHYLRDSLGAMVSPLLDALAPAIDFIIDKFVDLLNVINQFFATLTGKETWRKAVKTATEYEESTEGAASAQKKLNHQLMAFDELNNITTSQSGGRGKSGGSAVGAEEFEEVQISDWMEELKSKIQSGDWGGLGTLLGEKLNSLVSGWNAEEWGARLGQKFQQALNFFNNFMSTTDWDQIGQRIGQAINGFLDNINPDDLGQALVAKLQAAINFLHGLTWTVDLTPIGLAFASAINTVFDEDFSTTVGETIAGAINDGIDFLKGLIVGGYKEYLDPTTGEVFKEWRGGIDFSQVGKGFMNMIATAVEKIEWSDLGETIGKLGTGLLDAVKGALEYAVEHIDVILQAAWDFITSLFSVLWDYFVDNIWTLVTDLWEYIQEHFWDSGSDSPGNQRKDDPIFSTGLGQVGSSVVSGLQEGLEGVSATAAQMAEALDSAGGAGASALGKIGGAARTARTRIGKIPPLPDEVTKFQSTMTTEASAVDKIKSSASGAAKGIDAMKPSTKDGNDFKKALLPFRTALSGKDSSVKASAAKARTSITDMKPSEAAQKKFKAAISPFKSVLGGKKDSIVAAAGGAKDSILDVTPSTKETSDFTTAMDSWADAIGPVESLGTQLDTNLKDASKPKTITITDKDNKLHDYADEASKLSSSLQSATSKTWKVHLAAQFQLKQTGSGEFTIREPVMKANGGWADLTQGSVFVAGEVPGQAEMVGQINGRTGVASGAEITGIADAVYNTGDAEAALLREQNRLLRQLLAKNTNVTLAPNVAAGRWVAQAQTAYARATGG